MGLLNLEVLESEEYILRFTIVVSFLTIETPCDTTAVLWLFEWLLNAMYKSNKGSKGNGK